MKGLIQFFALLLLTSQLALATHPPTEKGSAKFYADNFHGRKTVSGALYDKNKLTAAHKSLPFGTMVRVDNPANGKYVIVEVNDRGPFTAGDIIELSRKAADMLGASKQQSIPVVLSIADRNATNATSEPTAVAPKVVEKIVTNEPTVKVVTPAPKVEVKEAAKPIEKAVVKTAPAVAPTKKEEPKVATVKKADPIVKKADPAPKKTNVVVDARDIKTGGFYKMQVLKLAPKGFGVQIAGYTDYESVTQQLLAIQKSWFKGATVFVDELNGKPYYKIILGPMPTKAEAESYSASIKKNYGIKNAFVVDIAALSSKNAKSSDASVAAKKTDDMLEEAKNMTAGGYYKMQVLQLETVGYGVQAMGYTDYQAVLNQLAVLQEHWFDGAAVFVDDLNGKPYYKIILGPMNTKAQAESYAASLKKKYKSMTGAFVVDIATMASDMKNKTK